MSFGVDLKSSVVQLIADHGVDVTLRNTTHSAYDPSQGTTTPNTPVDTIIRAVFLDYKLSEIDGSLILRGDRKAVFTADSDPEVTDQIIGEGDTVTIVDFKKIKSGSTVVAYVAQVRANG